MPVIFSNQLYSNDIIKSITNNLPVIMYDPLESDNLKLNKLRLVYQRHCVEHYVNYLNTHVNTDVFTLSDIKRKNVIVAFDPEDHTIKAQFKKLGVNVTWLDSPSFLTSSELLE